MNKHRLKSAILNTLIVIGIFLLIIAFACLIVWLSHKSVIFGVITFALPVIIGTFIIFYITGIN